MNTAVILTRTRAIAASIMVDACTIARTTVGALNEGTGQYATTSAVIYTGPCRIKPAATATADAAGIAVDTSRPVLELPWSDDPIAAPGDMVTMTSGPLSGAVLDVYAELSGTTSTARRYTCEARGLLAGD